MRPLALLVAVFITWCVSLSPSSAAGQTTTPSLLTPAFWETATPESVRAAIARGADPNARNIYGETPLHWAARKTDNPANITALVRAGADLNARDKFGETPLHLAAQWTATPAIITALVEAGVDPNARNIYYATSLHLAAVKTDNLAIITALVRAGADLNARDKDGKTPLEYARMHNDHPAVSQALARAMTAPARTPPLARANPVPRTPTSPHAQRFSNIEEQPTTPYLVTSAFWETATPESVRAEIARGADPNARDKYGETPLHWAVWKTNNLAIINALAAAGADPNARDKYGKTPLHVAAMHTATPVIITALVAAGADPNVRDKGAATPLHVAVAQTATLANITALVRAGADLNARAKNGWTPLHWAAEKTTNPAIITALVAAGADLNARNNNYGSTPLHRAAAFTTTPAIITALIEAGADPNAQAKDGATPLHVAAMKNDNSAIITALVAAGADLNARTKRDKTPLHLAAEKTTTPAIITALVAAGADPNARATEADATPLHWAARWNATPAIITALVEAGADPMARNKDGKTPLDIASKHNNHPDVSQTLASAMPAPERTPPVARVTPAPKTSTPSPASQFPTTPVAVQFTQAPVRPDDIAVIIGNADYTQGQDIPNVKPAYADAEGIKRYVTQALGVREGNIIYLKDATGTELTRVFGNKDNPEGQLYDWVQPHSRVFVYYSGHGAPTGEEGSVYLVPVDADSRRIHLSGYPLATLHRNLAYLPVESVTLVLEACFSGVSEGGDVVPKSSRITVAPAPVVPQNMTVITAGAADQLASWEEDESHGLFTKYFLLGMSGQADQKNGNGDGQVTLTELDAYLKKTLTYFARRYYGRDQVAQITPATR